VKRVYPIEPTSEEFPWTPNEQESGDINFQMRFTELDADLEESDIHLFWTYEAPKELHIRR
jgi:hypothetical protein